MPLARKIYNYYFSSSKEFTKFLKPLIGFIAVDPALYKPVFQHKSLFPSAEDNFERLELLGDSILNSIISEYLYKKYPNESEGFLTGLRSKIVNRKQLNEIGNRLSLIDFIQYDKKSTNGIHKDISGNAFEALIGAMYLDSGYKVTKKFVIYKILSSYIDIDKLNDTEFDFKSRLYHYIQRESKSLKFKQTNEQLIKNRRYFTICAFIDNVIISEGYGYTKKAAEQDAAEKALKVIDY